MPLTVNQQAIVSEFHNAAEVHISTLLNHATETSLRAQLARINAAGYVIKRKRGTNIYTMISRPAADTTGLSGAMRQVLHYLESEVTTIASLLDEKRRQSQIIAEDIATLEHMHESKLPVLTLLRQEVTTG